MEIWASDQLERGAIWPLCSTAIRSGFNANALITSDNVDGDSRASSAYSWPFKRMVSGMDIRCQAIRWVLEFPFV